MKFNVIKGFVSKREEKFTRDYFQYFIGAGCRILVSQSSSPDIWLSMASGELGITPADSKTRIGLSIDAKKRDPAIPQPSLSEIPYYGYEVCYVDLNRADRVVLNFYRDRKSFSAKNSLHGHLRKQYEIPFAWFERLGVIERN